MTKSSIQYFLTVGYVLCLTAIAWYFHDQSFFGTDDANIYMVYMKHLAEGHGFVYNVGGERVEGFTSLLWTIIGALFFKLTTFPEIWLMGLNVLLVSYGLFAITRFIRIHAPYNVGYIYLFFALISSSLGYIEWTVYSLLETGLWSVLLILTSLQIMQVPADGRAKTHTLRLAIYFLLLLLTRPESMLWVPVFILLNGLKEYWIGEPFRKTWSNILVLAGTAGLGLASLIGWRISYFGYPLPNTYYAKVSADWQQNLLEGLSYDFSFFINYPIVLLGVLYALIQWGKKIWNLKRRAAFKEINILLVFIILGVTLFNPIVSGGDYFKYYRFIQPTLPIIFLAPILTLVDSKVSLSPKKWIGIVFLCVCSLSVSIYYFWFGAGKMITSMYVHTPNRHWRTATMGRKNAMILNNFFEPLEQMPSQGVMAAGGNALVYNGITIDLLGLNNTKMAHAEQVKDEYNPKNHQSFNKQVFYELQPDFINATPFIQDTQRKYIILNRQFFLDLSKNIVFDQKFKETYALCLVERKGFKPYLNVFARKGFLESLDTSIYKINILPYE